MAVLFVFVGAFAALAIYYFYRFFCSCCQRDGEQSFTVGRLSPDPDASRHYSQFGSLEIIGISPDEFSD